MKTTREIWVGFGLAQHFWEPAGPMANLCSQNRVLEDLSSGHCKKTTVAAAYFSLPEAVVSVE